MLPGGINFLHAPALPLHATPIHTHLPGPLMAQRPIWRGHLRLALVSCPVALFNARHSREALTFHMINPATGNRVRMVTQDAETGQELRRADLVKGYEFEKHRYLLLDDEDFDAARSDTSTTMKVDKFVEAGSVDPVYYDASYYMAPDGNAADDVYSVLYQAIAETGRAALSRITMARRERAVLITPMAGGLAVHTLLEERDLNAASDVFGSALAHEPEADMVALAKQLIDRQVGTYNPADAEDLYETRLRAVIAAKLEGKGVAAERAPVVSQSNVVDIMAALRRSLGQVAGNLVDKPAAAKKARAVADKGPTSQAALKLPIKGGKKASGEAEPLAGRAALASPTSKRRRA